MDRSTVDGLARALATSGSRRAALAIVAAAVTGGVVVETADAGKKKPKPCKVCERRAGKKCKPKLDESVCNGSGLCFQGQCISRPACLGNLEGPCTSVGANTLCCGGYCDIAGGMTFCTQSSLNEPCLTTDDCETGACIAYRCRNAPPPL